MKQVTQEEVSAGGVVYRKVGEGYELMLGKHSGYHKWVLPKGMVEKGESLTETAVREVEEEVGIEAMVVAPVPIKTIEYWYYADLDPSSETTRRVAKYAEAGGAKTRIHKKVVFYLMEIVKDLGKAGWEMEERRWVSYAEGQGLLSFETEREVWTAAGKILGIVGAPAET